MEWSSGFLALRPSAAKVFAIAWQKKVAEMLQERGLSPADAGEVLDEAFKATVAESSSLPVRDRLYRLITLECAMLLMAFHHPYGSTVDRTMRARGLSDRNYVRYFSVLRRHGIGI